MGIWTPLPVVWSCVSSVDQFVVVSLALYPLCGRDFFPSVDAGLIKLHVRGAPGTRLEESEKRVAAIQDTIRSVIPKEQLDSMLDVMGIPASGINLSLSEGALISAADAQILIALKPGHAPTAGYVEKLRRAHSLDPSAGPFDAYRADIEHDCIVGTPERAIARLRDYAGIGVQRIFLNHELYDDLGMLDLIAGDVLPEVP